MQNLADTAQFLKVCGRCVTGSRCYVVCCLENLTGKVSVFEEECRR